MAWIWPCGSGEIQTSFQAGGMASALTRWSVRALVMTAPDGSRYRKLPSRRTRVIPGPRGSLRVSPETADGAGSPAALAPVTSVAPSITGGRPS